MSNHRSPYRPITVPSLRLPSTAAIRDFILVVLAWSMLTPTLALAGATGRASEGRGRPTALTNRARVPATPPAQAASTPTSVNKVKADGVPDAVGTDFWLVTPATPPVSGAASVLLAGDTEGEGTASRRRRRPDRHGRLLRQARGRVLRVRGGGSPCGQRDRRGLVLSVAAD